MVVKTTVGSTVSLETTDGKSLFDRDGVEWARCPECDVQDPFGCAYRETKNNIACVLLTMDELKRTIKGTRAMQSPTTVEEMRYYVLHMHRKCVEIVDSWPDQKLREIMIEAEESNHDLGDLLKSKIECVLITEKQKDMHPVEKTPREAQEGTSVGLKAHGTPRNTPRRKKQEGSLSVALDDISVLLTPKQLEFMERLSECPGWTEQGTAGTYIASQYAEELSDTMNPMSMGAVLTTLREKGLIATEKSRIGGIKCCMFTLTDVGVRVYNVLARVEVQHDK